MKKYLTKLLSLALVLLCCLSLVVPVSAASSAKLKITYKGKTIAVASPVKKLSYSKVKKAWGKANEAEHYDKIYCNYTYKKGKTDLTVGTKKSNVNFIYAEIRNKSVKMNGIYVGMKKSTTKKLLIKNFGKSHVSYSGGEYYVTFGKEGFIIVRFNKKGTISQIVFSTIEMG